MQLLTTYVWVHSSHRHGADVHRTVNVMGYALQCHNLYVEINATTVQLVEELSVLRCRA